jgi:hypothetical protein
MRVKDSKVWQSSSNSINSINSINSRGYSSSSNSKTKEEIIEEAVWEIVAVKKDLKELKDEKLKPENIYTNFNEDKVEIKKNEKRKSGIYMFVNIKDGDKYIGKTIHIASRMNKYWNFSINEKRTIIGALREHGEENFALLIVEYIDLSDWVAGLAKLMLREEYYINKLNPKYNMIKAGHGISVVTVEARNNMSRSHSKGVVYIYNIEKELEIISPSRFALSNKINCSHTTITNFMEKGTIFKGKWYLSWSLFNIVDIPKRGDWSSESSLKLLELMRNENRTIASTAVFVYNLDGILENKFRSIRETGRVLKMSKNTVKRYAESNLPYKDKIFSFTEK